MPELYPCGACAQQRPPHKFRAKALYEHERGKLKAKDLKCTDCTGKPPQARCSGGPQPVTGAKRAAPSPAPQADKRQKGPAESVPVASPPPPQPPTKATDPKGAPRQIVAVNQQITEHARYDSNGHMSV